MNNQNYQILLGIILLVVYFTCFRKSEGFFGMGTRSVVGTEYCFTTKASLYGGTRRVRSMFGLLAGSGRVVKRCKGGKVRKVITQIMNLQTYKSWKPAFRSRRRRWRTFKRSSGWTSKPLPADKKKADMALLTFAGRGYQSMIIYNFGKANSRVRLNKKNIPLSGWSSKSNDGPAKGSFIRRGLTDPAIRRQKRLQKRLRNCNKKLRAARSPSGSPAMAVRVPSVQQSGGGDAW